MATDWREEVAGLMRGIRMHMAPNGTAVLNAFRPKLEVIGMPSDWPSRDEMLAREVKDGDTVVRCYDRRLRAQDSPLVPCPELVYRRFRGDEQVAVLEIAMRCWYPEDLLGFRTRAWPGPPGLTGYRRAA